MNKHRAINHIEGMIAKAEQRNNVTLALLENIQALKIAKNALEESIQPKQTSFYDYRDVIPVNETEAERNDRITKQLFPSKKN